jgi:hypothetical protein
MNRFSYIFFSVVLSTSIFAQEFSLNSVHAPFKGRRHMVGLDFDVLGGGGIPGLMDGLDASPISFGVGGFYQIQAYKSWNVRLGFNYYQSNQLLDFNVMMRNPSIQYRPEESESDYSKGILSTTLTLRKYRKVSPFGTFFDIKVAYLSNSGGTLLMRPTNSSNPDRMQEISGLGTFTFGVGIGRNHVISEKLFLATSVHFDFIGLLQNATGEIFSFFLEPDESATFEDRTKTQFQRRMAATTMLSLKIELGYNF